jgi:hypothetical protein
LEEGVGLFGETDGREGAAGAFGRIFEGRREDGVLRSGPSGVNGGDGIGDDGVVNGEADALFGGGVIDDGFGTGVAVFAKEHGLEGELDAVGRPHFEAGFGFARAAVFVIDGDGEAGGNLEEINFRDDAEGFGGESDGAGFEIVGEIFGWGKGGAFSIDAFVLVAAFDGVGAFAEDAFDEFIEEEAWAIDELIDHAGGEVIGEMGWEDFGEGGGHMNGFQTTMQGESTRV